MMAEPQAMLLPDGKRLHLNHGPIDLIIEADGAREDIRATYAAAASRFNTVLTELASELPLLRREISIRDHDVTGDISLSMARAVFPFRAHRVTPMAAVAGAVADEILRTMTRAAKLSRAYVNNGGDIALHLADGESFAIAAPSGPVNITSNDKPRGIATSGWRGRSFSLGIADAVTVLAGTAAEADAAATLIANAVDLPYSPKVKRQPACEIAPDSDLKDRRVTIAVAPLTAQETQDALARGLAFAERCVSSGLITAAALMLNGEVVRTSFPPPFTGEVPSHRRGGEGPLRRVPRHLSRARERNEPWSPHA